MVIGIHARRGGGIWKYVTRRFHSGETGQAGILAIHSKERKER